MTRGLYLEDEPADAIGASVMLDKRQVENDAACVVLRGDTAPINIATPTRDDTLWRPARRASDPRPRPPHRVLMMHPMDPRGRKLGGIETHIRLMLAHHPHDFSILFVGVDELGDLPIGVVTPVSFEGRTIDFLPVARIDTASVNRPGSRLFGTTTFRFAAGAFRHIAAIRRARDGARSAELQRFEYALIPRLAGLPTVHLVHGEGSKDQAMDSLIKKYWIINAANEKLALRLASRIVAVNENIVRRFERVMPWAAAKSDVMPVSVDTRRFAMRPFDTRDGIFRICFAGRLDAFKDPPLMFRTIAAVAARLEGRVEFHYVGASDPKTIDGYAAIEPFTVLHGLQPGPRVAAIMATTHAGILTSFFEGMPCYLLEMLSIGRPTVAIRLPQFDPLLREGVSGALIERSDDRDFCVSELAAAFVRVWEAIQAGRLNPATIHDLAEPYSIDAQLSLHFARHRALQANGA